MNTKLPLLDELLNRDLDYICGNLREEFGRMAGKNLLITGGAGFLGYYLVLAALHWNKTADSASKIRVTVYDNFVRGTPEWLTTLQINPALTVERQDLIQPLPANIADFQYIIHAAGIASPIYYRKYPLQTIDANVNGLRNLLDYSVRQAEPGKPVDPKVDEFLRFILSQEGQDCVQREGRYLPLTAAVVRDQLKKLE